MHEYTGTVYLPYLFFVKCTFNYRVIFIGLQPNLYEMPKGLSLKKAQPKIASTQKPITQFFKAATCEGSHNTKINIGKRKEISPVKVDSISNIRKENSEVSLKKIKKNDYLSAEDNNFEANKLEDKNESEALDPSNIKVNGTQRRSPLTSINHELIKNNGPDFSSFKMSKSCIQESEAQREKIKTPEKCINYGTATESPSKILNSFQDDELFTDEWDFEGVEEDIKEDLDLTIIQRCEVLQVTHQPSRMEIKLKNNKKEKGTCLIEGVWMNTPLQEGEIVSILASRNASGSFVINNTSGLLSLRPDHLISTTSVVAGVFCKRKAVLQERWRGIDSANTAMTVGILIHELVQKALTSDILDVKELRTQCDDIIKDSIQMLYDCGITESEARANMDVYVPPLADFMQTYKKPSLKAKVVK
ncbi:uncharacterized protein LOC126974025 isoform X2 [Leptidea sinapis]|uniref:uncharacterized protein LOC126974025 isoform X2 n=1 Tax=Leptidea sinapis TaxID=189913 RepID=UPI0021C27D49|nr:uncharacterized protein LOC126974025 isoform X2 [Leptidea sinapis]